MPRRVVNGGPEGAGSAAASDWSAPRGSGGVVRAGRPLAAAVRGCGLREGAGQGPGKGTGMGTEPGKGTGMGLGKRAGTTPEPAAGAGAGPVMWLCPGAPVLPCPQHGRPWPFPRYVRFNALFNIF